MERLNIRNEIQEAQEARYVFPYHQAANWRTGESLDYLSYMEFVRDLARKYGGDGRVLDAGCGDGRLACELHAMKCEVWGCDYSDRAIRFAKAFGPAIDFRVADLSDLPYKDDAFECAVLMEVFEHLQPDVRADVINELARCSRDGGRVIVTVPSLKVPRSADHYEHFSVSSLTQAWSVAFDLEHCWGHLPVGLPGTWIKLRMLLGEMMRPAGRWLGPLFEWWLTGTRRALVGKTGHVACDRANRLIAVFVSRAR